MDKLTRAQRSENMRRIKSVSTKPELIVQKAIYGMGFRYRLHRTDLPGKPDIVLMTTRKAVFVHGCFWHQHGDPKCLDACPPKSCPEYWLPKLKRNQERDEVAIKALSESGWSVMVIWECGIKYQTSLRSRLKALLGPSDGQ